MYITDVKGSVYHVFVFHFDSRDEWERIKSGIWDVAKDIGAEERKHISDFLDKVGSRLTDRYAQKSGELISTLFANEICTAMMWMMMALVSVGDRFVPRDDAREVYF